MEQRDDLLDQIRERLGDNADRYDLGGIVQAILDRYGDVATLDYIDPDTLHAIFSANET
jgi:hypothetical protein